MIVYAESKRRFIQDVSTERIEDLVAQKVYEGLGIRVSPAEVTSWRNSLVHMSNVLSAPEIPDDAGISVEYSIPLTSKRIDMIVTGQSEDKVNTAVIIELKQWSQVDVTELDGIVRTPLAGGFREVSHPSYQAWSYAAHIEDYNETVRKEKIRLLPCVSLHNLMRSTAINDPRYKSYIQKAPVFIAGDFSRLQDFLRKSIKYGDIDDLMYRIDHGRIKPSKALADALVSMMQGNEEFFLLDDQKLAYETAMRQAIKSKDSEKKSVVIAKGGPGTGKSVIAVNLLVNATKRGLVAQYVSRNSAPRVVFQAKLTGSMTKSRINNLFKGSGSFTDTPDRFFDFLVVDEAHRLNEKSGMYMNKGINQIKEIINASKASIFFIDESQRVHFKDIGSVQEIRKWASEAGAEVYELELSSQFRCNGSDAYLAWLDNTLDIRETVNRTLSSSDFELFVVDSPEELESYIRSKNELANKARMVAGYCWDWKSKKDPAAYDIEFDGHDFSCRWNLASQGMTWIIDPDSVGEVGCVHTCQGLELDHVGVIIGPDLVVRDGVVITDGTRRSKHDRTMQGFKGLLKSDLEHAIKKADEIIKNTYRTLMTRGQKSCVLYSEDKETRDYFRSRLVEIRSAEVVSIKKKKEIVYKVRHERVPIDQLAVLHKVSEGEIRSWVAKVKAAEDRALEE